MYHLPPEDKPAWLTYPASYDEMIAQGKVDINFWYLMEANTVRERMRDLQERYPDRGLIPFARRDDNDDIACWDARYGSEKVVIFHDFASSGWEEKQIFASFEEWRNQALATS